MQIIEEVVQKLYTLPESQILQVLDFIKSLDVHQENLILTQEHQEFEAIANQLAEEFHRYVVNKNIPDLSDYAISRADIYEEHP
jgi:hypothetical protein